MDPSTPFTVDVIILFNCGSMFVVVVVFAAAAVVVVVAVVNFLKIKINSENNFCTYSL